MQADTCVVDKGVNRDGLVGQLTPQHTRGAWFGQVSRTAQDGHAVLIAKLAGDMFQPFSRTRHQHEVMSARGEQSGEFQPDAARRPGHECSGSSCAGHHLSVDLRDQ